MPTKSGRQRAVELIGIRAVERLEAAGLRIIAAAKGGRARAKALSPEKRSEIARKGGLARARALRAAKP